LILFGVTFSFPKPRDSLVCSLIARTSFDPADYLFRGFIIISNVILYMQSSNFSPE